MRRAMVRGYQIKLWGTYPALVDGEPNQPVYGMMCEILSQAHMARLAAYETDKYSLENCFIDILNDDNSIEKTRSRCLLHVEWRRRMNYGRAHSIWKKGKELRSLAT